MLVIVIMNTKVREAMTLMTRVINEYDHANINDDNILVQTSLKSVRKCPRPRGSLNLEQRIF